MRTLARELRACAALCDDHREAAALRQHANEIEQRHQRHANARHLERLFA